jgi:hypothetical protein
MQTLASTDLINGTFCEGQSATIVQFDRFRPTALPGKELAAGFAFDAIYRDVELELTFKGESAIAVKVNNKVNHLDREGIGLRC